jgi:hypothetical protein
VLIRWHSSGVGDLVAVLAIHQLCMFLLTTE